MSRQSWALEPAQICAALFCDKVDDNHKVRIAALVLLQKPEDFTFPLIIGSPYYIASLEKSLECTSQTPTSSDLSRGKPPLPEIKTSKSLADYVTPRSVVFFARFCPDAERWLS